MLKKILTKACLNICILLLAFQIGFSRNIIPTALAQQASIVTNPQYIFVRKAPNQSQTFPFNTNNPNSIVKGGFEEIINVVGTRGTSDRKLGIAVFFETLNGNPENLKLSLQKSIQYSKETKLPLLIKLDAFNWWDYRPDLWNWFDQSLPGFDVNNKANVEWTSYDESSATKIAWRNWGQQIRVRPQPNMGSPKYRQAQKEVLDKLLPDIKAFKESLSPEDQYLFGGVVIGVEMAVGTNYYHYKNGNAAYDKCPKYDSIACASLPANDPQHFVDPTTGVNYTNNTLSELGFNAAKTLGIRTSGALTAEDNDRVIKNYLDYLNAIVQSYDIPVNKVYSHTGGCMDGSVPGFKGTCDSAKANAVIPGWSFYYGSAQNPAGVATVVDFMSDTNNATYPWIAPEWLPGGYKDKALWLSSFDKTLNYKNNKLIGVANWESIFGCVERNADYSCKVNVTGRDFNGGNNAIQAIADVLNQPTTSYCSISPSYLINTTKQNNQTIIEASLNKSGTSTYINASTSKELNTYGVLKTPNLINSAIDNANPQYTYTGSHTGTAYIQFITDGCSGKRMFSEIFTIQIAPSQTTCSKKSQGDANCDGRITTIDFEIWRQEFQKTLNTKQSDFDNNGTVSLGDFEIWRRGFSSQ
jgi:hypothetical protein